MHESLYVVKLNVYANQLFCMRTLIIELPMQTHPCKPYSKPLNIFDSLPIYLPLMHFSSIIQAVKTHK